MLKKPEKPKPDEEFDEDDIWDGSDDWDKTF